ncbi:MAG: methyltransferase [Deltaproteobacteria bacterium]|nr:methyltransferase [Deltaproteobacteria bacterium]
MSHQKSTRLQIADIAQFLEAHRPLWEQRPFVSVPVPWETEWTELSLACRAVTSQELRAAEADPVAFFSARGVALPLMQRLKEVDNWASLIPDTMFDEPPRPAGVDGRKWSQITRFVQAAVPFVSVNVRRWVDWCAGKGHLGNAMCAQTGHPGIALELDAQLVRRMSAMQPGGALLQFRQSDVLVDNLHDVFDANTGVVALHACGHLNSRLLALSATCRPAFLAVVPCCYQRIDGMSFSPMSNAARQTGFGLTRHQLRLPALDEVTVSDDRRRFRKREMAFRQGTDLLLRDSTGKDEYTPLGRIPPYVIRAPFEQFARFSAAKIKLPLPVNVNWRAAEAAGYERQHLVSALSLSRQLFRRSLETWLFLDRIAFLEERGFHVTAGIFCSREITPRNLMLLAHPM